MTAGARSGTRRAVSENLQHIVCYAKVYTLLFLQNKGLEDYSLCTGLGKPTAESGVT